MQVRFWSAERMRTPFTPEFQPPFSGDACGSTPQPGSLYRVLAGGVPASVSFHFTSFFYLVPARLDCFGVGGCTEEKGQMKEELQ